MLKVVKYVVCLMLFIVVVTTCTTAFVISDKEKAMQTISTLSLNIVEKNSNEALAEEKEENLFTVFLYGGSFLLLLLASCVFYRFIFRTYSKKEGNQS